MKIGRYANSFILLILAGIVLSGCVSSTPPLTTMPPPSTAPPPTKAPPTTTPTAPTVSANNQFSLELYSNLQEKEEGNVFFSPYSISTALAMAYEGARGRTADEIKSVFHFPGDDSVRRLAFATVYNRLNKKDANYKLDTANALWVQQDYKLLDNYTETIEGYYDGKATNVDFNGATEQTRQTINSWVENKTNDKIKDLFPQGSLGKSTRLALTNAIYFKGTWVKQFNKNDTRDEDFRVRRDKTVKAPMMKRTDKNARFNYAETDGLQILEMPYEGEKLSMLVLLPKNDDLKHLEDSLTLERLNEWKTQLKGQSVEVFVPKFTFTTRYSLNENLKELGMPMAFSDAADFSGIDGTRSLSIQIVVHQAFIDVNEEGTEAAAATGVTFGPTAMPPPASVPIFRADHPFIFIIQERETGNILFFGRVIDPTK